MKYKLSCQSCRKQEQEENPTAVIHALKAYDKNLRSFKARKYIGDTGSSSDSSVSNESGIIPDENHKSQEVSGSSDNISPDTKQLSAATSGEEAAAGATVSSIFHTDFVMSFFITFVFVIFAAVIFNFFSGK